MSIHCQNPKTEKSLRIKRNRQLLGSIMLSISTVVMIMGILSLFLLAPEPQITTELTVVTYHEKQDQDDKPEKKKPKETVPKKPSAPTSQVSKVIHSHAVSNVSVPVHEVDVQVPSVDFGESLDFGQVSSKGFRHGRSYGDGDGGDGNGHGGQVVSHDDAKSSVRRVAYVIELEGESLFGVTACEASARGLGGLHVRNEVSRSLAELGENMHYQLIPFYGAPWLHDSDSITPRDTRKPPGWLKASDAQKNESLAYVRETRPWLWGPRWKIGMDIAMQMDPKPNVIFFISDGVHSRKTCELAGWAGNKAKNQDIIINTVTVEPSTSLFARYKVSESTKSAMKSAMYKLSDVSGGTYVQIKQDGTRYDYHGNRIKSDPYPVHLRLMTTACTRPSCAKCADAQEFGN